MTEPYGTWRSPISAALVASQGLRLGSVSRDGDAIYWIEGRPHENGRNVLVRRRADGTTVDVTPPGFNTRSRVHEYGGGAYLVDGERVYFVNFADQRLYAMTIAGGAARPLTPEGAFCHGDLTLDRAGRRLICIREDHTEAPREAVTTLVSIPLEDGPVIVVASGEDFYSTPRVSPDGTSVCWLSWCHPRMPWDGTELWVATLRAGGMVEAPRLVAGGSDESIYQPGWLEDGSLVFASDRDGWWRLYRATAGPDTVESVLTTPPPATEFGRPQWTLGTSTWASAGRDRLVVSFTRAGRWGLGVVDLATGTLSPIAPRIQPDEWLAASASDVVLVAGESGTADAVVRVALDGSDIRTLKRASDVELDAAWVSEAEAIEFPTADGLAAHAFYYAPRNPTVQAPAAEHPPLIVIGHGGPIAAADPTFDLKIQFWTTRGFAVVDVNYGGSTGFGRAYRRRLNGLWGIVDVADLINAARFLVATGRADARRLVIRGGSAGGYTVLAALTQYPEVFSAGASYFGISDLEALIADSHKFEARCLDILVGPYPQMRDEYQRRSPIHSVDRLSCPLILLQGLEDKVVPPNQSEMMADALRRQGQPVAYLTFAGEQHGFRRADSIIRSLEAELAFYGAVFGFRPADAIAPVPIENAHRLPSRASISEGTREKA
jgi:dipeptidyl aminopeptidase/acylaminoacyl peptidase